MKIDVLDKGYIELVDSLGDDLTLKLHLMDSVKSLQKRTESYHDSQLNTTLLPDTPPIMFIISPRVLVMRQWYKHVVGIETTSSHVTKDPLNEISGRYVPYDEFYEPPEFRKQSQKTMHKIVMD